MKLTKLLSAIAILIYLFLFVQNTQAQYLYGRTDVNYDESTRRMTATSSTEVDFAAQEYYQAYVNIKLQDANGSNLAVQTLADSDRDGFVEYSSEFDAGPDYSQYSLFGTHRARMSVQDPALNNRYIDMYYFGYNLDMGSEGGNAWRYVMYYGAGPMKTYSTQWLTIAATMDANIALDMPQGYEQIVREAWDNLNPEEKKWVQLHPQEAGFFLTFAQWAQQDTLANFSDVRDGTRANAFQHAFWNALMTQYCGSVFAKEFADNHEWLPPNAPPLNANQTARRNMDFYNNNVGRQIAGQNPFTISREGIFNLVMNALNNGQLQVVCPPTCP